MSGAARKPSRAILVCEPQFVMRRTLVYTMTELNLGLVDEASHIDVAQRRLEAKPYHLIILSVEPTASAMELVARIRNGATACEAGVPLIALLQEADVHTESALQDQRVQEVLHKPIRARDVLQALVRMSQQTVPA